MIPTRILINPQLQKETDSLKTTGPSGEITEAILEYNEQTIKLGNYSYNVFIGTTAGKKGFPNQDFASVVEHKLHIGDKEYECLLLIVADGVSSKELSEETSKSIVENASNSFVNGSDKYDSFKILEQSLWNWIADGAQNTSAPHGESTVSLFLFAASQDETKGIALNCGDSRVFWATTKYVESAKVHTEVLNPRNAISFALGADRINSKIHHDSYFIDNPVEVFLCTDTFAYSFDGVHFPEEMIPTFGHSISSLRDHLTAISVKRI